MKLFTIAERQDAQQYQQTSFDPQQHQHPPPSFKQWESSRQLTKPKLIQEQLPTFIKQNPSQSILYNQPNHITIETRPSSPQLQKESSQTPRKSLTPRKKIFQQDYLTTKLKEALVEDIKSNNNSKIKENRTEENQQLPPATPITQQKLQKTTFINPQTSKSELLPSRASQSRSVHRTNYPINYQRRSTDKINTNLILTPQKQQSPPPLPHPSSVTTTIQPKNNNQYLTMIPQLLQRMQKNQKQISQLKNLLQQLIQQQKDRQKKLTNYLSQNNNTNINSTINNHDRVIEKVFVQEEITRQKNIADQHVRKEMEKQQMKRLQILIQENRYLCQKVMQQKMRNSSSDNIQNTQIYQDKINILQQQRQVLQKDHPQNRLNNLDISVIPHQRMQNRPQKYHSKIVPVFNLTQQTTICHPKATNTLMARLQPPKTSQIPVRQVPRTKIY